MTTMGALLIIYAVSMAVATFIENDFGTPVAKSMVYNAWWFNGIMLLLAVNLIANIFKYKLYVKAKWSLFLFHSAFIIMLLGAAITRFISFEGSLHIREGEKLNYILSENSSVKIKLGEDSILIKKSFTKNNFKPFSRKINNTEINFNEFIVNAAENLVPVKQGKPYVQIAVFEKGNMQHYWLEENKVGKLKEATFIIGNDTSKADVSFKKQNDKVYVKLLVGGSIKEMQTQKTDTIEGGKWYAAEKNQLYSFDKNRFVVSEIYPNAEKRFLSSGGKQNGSSINALKGIIKKGTDEIPFTIIKTPSEIAQIKNFEINGDKVQLSYGQRKILLPFQIQLQDFQLERYPGSGSPSSYASEVKIIDKEKNKNFNYHIYMNHVLDYRGFRFFQSSYDRDEKGSILSVNHDGLGTFLTYLGYLLMAMGMFWSLANKNSRFHKLLKANRKLHKERALKLILLLFFLSSGHLFAQNINRIPEKHAHHFGQIYVQDKQGRLKTINILSSEILRKMSRKSKWKGQTPEQVFLGMIVNSKYWTNEPIIHIADKKVLQFLNLKDKDVRFNDVVDLQTGQYKLKDAVNIAYAKSPAERNKFDKEVIKADERINIFYLCYVGKFLTIFPNPDKPEEMWHIPGDTKLQVKDSSYYYFAQDVFVQYYKSVKEAFVSGKWNTADSIVNYIILAQEKYGKNYMPSKTKVHAEEFYTNAQIFERLFPYYGTVGFILIIMLFLQILQPKWKFKWPVKISVWAIVIMFVAHTLGLILRWYISGHAPWSNGYEAMIYISWVLVLAGIVFSKNSKMGLAATALLSSIMLLVAHLNWMDPTITNLVPVLKSYWLSIHVSIITASYGFLGLSALLGFLVMLMMSLMNKKNASNILVGIKELSQVNEISLIVGLYLLTIGTFLGGVWANESWGRYWGWDPKETWALISVVVYSFVAHIRLIPGLKGYFPMNLSAAWSYWVIMMTFFGVNFYLSGMHSYAQGDPVPIPMFIYYLAGSMYVISVIAYFKFKKYNSKTDK